MTGDIGVNKGLRLKLTSFPDSYVASGTTENKDTVSVKSELYIEIQSQL